MFTLIKNVVTQQEGCHLLKSHVTPFCCPFLALHLSKWPLSSHDLYNIHTGLAREIWTLVLMSDIVSITKKGRPSLSVTRRQAALEGRLVFMCHSIPWLEAEPVSMTFIFLGKYYIQNSSVQQPLVFTQVPSLFFRADFLFSLYSQMYLIHSQMCKIEMCNSVINHWAETSAVTRRWRNRTLPFPLQKAPTLLRGMGVGYFQGNVHREAGLEDDPMSTRQWKGSPTGQRFTSWQEQSASGELGWGPRTEQEAVEEGKLARKMGSHDMGHCVQNSESSRRSIT